MFKTFILLCAAVFLPFVSNASELSEKLQSSEYVLLMRHTRAPGIGDPENFNLNDCSTQRNLSDEGKQQAIRIGNWLKEQEVTSAIVLSSPWCRCNDTAQLINFGDIEVASALSSFFNETNKANQRNQDLQRLISEKLKFKSNHALILVTHEVNISGYTGESVAAGEMVLAKVDNGGRLQTYLLVPRPEIVK